MQRSAKLISISLIALFVSGCAVTTKPLDRTQSEQRSYTDLGVMFRDQEPVTAPITLHDAMARALKYNLEAR